MYPIKASVNNRPNEIVRAMQGQLKYMSYYVDVDGIYGPQTAKAVKRFCDTPQRRVPYGSDGQGLPLLSYEIVRAVRERYEKQPVMYAVQQKEQFLQPAGPFLQSSGSQLKAGPFIAPSEESALVDFISEVYSDFKDVVEAIFEEIKLMKNLKTSNPRQIINELNIKVTPRIKKLLATYDQKKQIRLRSNISHKAKITLKNDYNYQVNNLTPITHRFKNFLKKLRVDKKIENVMNSKTTSKALGGTNWLLRFWYVIKDLFNLFVGLLKGESINDQWLDKFEKDLADVADALIIGWIAELIAAGIIAVGVAAGVFAGPTILVTAIIVIIVAFLLGFIFDKIDFSPTRFILNILSWVVVNLFIMPDENTQRAMAYQLYST